MENLENRFILNEVKPVIYVISEKGDPLTIDDLNFKTIYIDFTVEDSVKIINKLILSTADAVYTNVKNQFFIDKLVDLGVVVYCPYKVKGIKTYNINKFGTKLYTFGGIEKTVFNQKTKRLEDVIIGFLGLAAAAIIYIIFAPLIKLESRGPVLFKQTRIGYNGRRFEIIKFRTMYENADEKKEILLSKNEMPKQLFKIENDPRITKIGSFMRKRSLDEFPQFFNVLSGEMSLVGTRPPTVDELKKYQPHHKARLLCKPGITGIWQTKGRNNITDFDKIVNMDKKYIKKSNLLLDMILIFKTIFCIIRKDGR